MLGQQRFSLRVALARSGLAGALLVALGVLSPVSAGVLWRSADGARIMVRNSAGVPVVVDNAFAKLPVSTTGGAGAMRAGQLLTVPGASTELALSRAISVANIARGLRIASGIAGPIGMIGLAYEGIVWATDHWAVASDAYPYPAGVTANRNFYQDGFPGQACDHYSDHCSYSDVVAFWLAKEAAIYGGTWTYEGETHTGTCSTVGQCNHTITIKSGSTTHTRMIYSQGSDGPAPGVGGPASDAQVETSLSNALQADPTKAGPMIEWIAEAVPLYDFEPGPIQVSGPSSLQGPTETTERQEGGNTYTTTKQTTYNLDFSGDTVTVTTTTVSTTVDASNNVVSQSTTTTQAPSSPEVVQQPQEKAKDPCGLPGTPPCKVDETGTPTASSTVSAGQGQLTSAFDARDAQVPAKTGVTSWGWLLPVPTLEASCSAINVAGLFTIDPCPALDISRIGFAFLWSILTGLYAWRRVGETVSGGV